MSARPGAERIRRGPAPPRAYAAWAALAALLGCGSEAQAPAGLASAGAPQAGSAGAAGQAGSAARCAPGLQRSCPCLGGAQGAQVCSDDGSRFGPCLGCGDQAGAGAAAGQGGAGSAGSAQAGQGGEGQAGQGGAGAGASGASGGQAGLSGSSGQGGAGGGGSAGAAGQGGAGSAGSAQAGQGGEGQAGSGLAGAGASGSAGAGGTPPQDCCQTSVNPGCSGLPPELLTESQRADEACVCKQESSCCHGGQWSSVCVYLGHEYCGFACGTGAENTEARCSDGKDNDDDGFADCADPKCCAVIDCSAVPATFCGSKHVTETTPVSCGDFLDNDFDKYTDCDDKQCCGFTPCGPSTYCGELLAGGGSCQGVFAPGAGCRACLDASCCSQSEACANDAGCKAYFGCIAPCGTEPGCVAACGQPPALYGPLVSCGMASCKGECVDDPAGPWGADGPSCRGLTFGTNAEQSCADTHCCGLSELCAFSNSPCRERFLCLLSCHRDHPGDSGCIPSCHPTISDSPYDALAACLDDHGCEESSHKSCTDGQDNDGDGLTDCDDPDCKSDPPQSGCSPDSAGTCCTPHPTPGCAQIGVQNCVCLTDAFCCANEWDASCAQSVTANGCGACPQGPGDQDDRYDLGVKIDELGALDGHFFRLVVLESGTQNAVANVSIDAIEGALVDLAFPDLLKKNVAYTVACSVRLSGGGCDPALDPGWLLPSAPIFNNVALSFSAKIQPKSDVCALLNRIPDGRDLIVQAKGFEPYDGRAMRFVLAGSSGGLPLDRARHAALVGGSFGFTWYGALQPGNGYTFAFTSDSDGVCHVPLDPVWSRTFVATDTPTQLTFAPQADVGAVCPP